MSTALRLTLWVLGVVLVVALGFVAYLIAPIVVSSAQGSSGQVAPVGYPLSVSATGADGRTRILTAQSPEGSEVDLSLLMPGQQIVVTGEGYDSSLGIYVAICQIPDSPTTRPGPCLGGVPELDAEAEIAAGSIQWSPANWINDDWAWKLFGARSYDDLDGGTFTAYILVPPGADEFVDCTEASCGLFTRNDHTALENRVQDLYLPVSFSK